MGEGLFVHASNSLGVISIACSITVPFEQGKKVQIQYGIVKLPNRKRGKVEIFSL